MPLIVKLSPGRDYPGMCKAVRGCGRGRHQPVQHLPGLRHRSGKAPSGDSQHLRGPVSGPAVRPIALRMVWQAVGAVSIPVVGLGGIPDRQGRAGVHHGRCDRRADWGTAISWTRKPAPASRGEINRWMDAHGVKTLEGDPRLRKIKAFPRGRWPRPDEGHLAPPPFTGSNGKAAPHQSAVRAADGFP